MIQEVSAPDVMLPTVGLVTIGWKRCPCKGAGAVPPEPGIGPYLLQEDGSRILLEDGSGILLENSAGGVI